MRNPSTATVVEPSRKIRRPVSFSSALRRPEAVSRSATLTFTSTRYALAPDLRAWTRRRRSTVSATVSSESVRALP